MTRSNHDAPPLRSNDGPRRRWTWLVVLVVMLAAGSWLLGEIALWRAYVCLESRAHQHALRWLSVASIVRPRQAETEFLLARTKRRLGQYDTMSEHLERARDLGYDQNKLVREQWLAQAQIGQYQEMRGHWSELFANAGSDGPEISKAFVTGTLSQLRLADANKVLNAWEADFPNDPDQFFLRGKVLFVQLDHAEAAKQFRKVLELAPEHLEARFQLAVCLMNLGEIAEAASHLERLLRKRPDHLEAQVALASCFIKLDRLDDGRTRLKDVLARHPDHVDALLELGHLELAAKRPDEALPLLRRTEALRPEDRELVYALAKALQATGHTEEAHKRFAFVDEATKELLRLKNLTHALLKNPDDLQVRFEVARITWTYKSRDEGARWWLSLLEIAPDHAATHAALAEHFRQKGDLAKAEWHQQRATSPPP